MFNSVGFRERATEKSMHVEPTGKCVRFFLRNESDGLRMHMDLNREDVSLLVHLLQSHLIETEDQDQIEGPSIILCGDGSEFISLPDGTEILARKAVK